MKAYIIIGETGEYEDRVEWEVVASLDKNKIIEYRDRLRKFLVDHKIPEESYYPCFELDSPCNPEDPLLDVYWRHFGVKYSISELELM